MYSKSQMTYTLQVYIKNSRDEKILNWSPSINVVMVKTICSLWQQDLFCIVTVPNLDDFFRAYKYFNGLYN